MINEIVNFVNSLPADVFQRGGALRKGLYVKVSLNDRGVPTSSEVCLYRAGKNEELTELLRWCFERQVVSRHLFAANFSFDSSNKIFIYTASPFAIAFKKKSIAGKKEEKVKNSLENYFRRARALIEPDNDTHQKWATQFESFCKEHLFDWIRQITEYEEVGDNVEIWVFFEGPEPDDFRQTFEKYLEEMVLAGDEPYGVSILLSKFPVKKRFMTHQSAPFLENRKISRAEGKAVWQFFELQKRNLFPNPLPVFIDKNELNREVVRLYNDEGVLSYSEIIRRLFEHHKIDLSNYYLFFFVGGDIADLDFVPSFRYHLTDMAISRFFRTAHREQGEDSAQIIKNIFEFERDVANVMFNRQLIVNNWLRYFGDIDFKKKKMSDVTYVMLLKYRQAFYEYIYKSRTQAITSAAFHDIMWHTIEEYIRLDKEWENDLRIRERMDIWFSLYYYFDSSNQNRTDMVNHTREILEYLQEAVEGDGPILRHDDDFAFAAGQIIRYLLLRSQSAQRSHAMLEPFLQKVQPEQFRQAIAKTFDTYKHELPLYAGDRRYPFDKLMSEVMGYEPDTRNMKELIPMVLAGYFAKSVFSRKQEAAEGTQNA